MNAYEEDYLIGIIEKNEFWGEDEYKILYDFSRSENVTTRIKVARLCAYSNESITRDILLKMIDDESTFVRTEVYDSLSSYKTVQISNVLKIYIEKETDEVALSYAVLSYIDIITQINDDFEKNIDFLSKILKNHNNDLVSLSCCYGLYLFGQKEYLESIEKYLKNPDYHIRCSAINLLNDLKNSENIIEIKNMMSNLLETEDSIVVIDYAKRLVDIL